MKTIFYKYLLLIVSTSIFLLCMESCSKKITMNAINYSSYYSHQSNFADFEVKFYHPDAVRTMFLCSVNNMGLKYKRGESGKEYTANYSISIKLANSITRKDVVFAQTIEFSDSLNFLNKINFIHEFNVPIQFDSPLYAIVELRDINLDKKYTEQLMVYPYENGGINDLILYDDAEEILFKNEIKVRDEIIVRSNKAYDSLIIEIYPFTEHLATPPFVTEQKDINLIKSIESRIAVEDSLSLKFAVNQPGIYRIRSSNHASSAYTLNVFDENFPSAANHQEMRSALRYITNNDEYKALLRQTNAKYAIDSFWMEVALGNDDLALTLIKKYYGRMENANSLFSKTSKGWKSDRGIIYMIYGQPDYVYKNDEIEEWWYGEPNVLYSEQFMFNRTIIEPGIEEFILEKDPQTKNNWFKKVEMLRK